MPKFSANLGFLWTEKPLLERIDNAAKAGFAGVEFHSPYQEDPVSIRQRCDDHGLTIVGVNSYTDDAIEKARVLLAPRHRKKAEHIIDRSLEFAQALGAGYLHVLSGTAEPDDRKTALDCFSQILAYAAENSRDSSFALAVEALNPYDKPGYLLSRIDDAARFISGLSTTKAKILFDAYHLGMCGDPVLAKFRAYQDLICHVQVAGIPDRNEVDQGTYDYGGFFRSLSAAGYQKWVGLEFKPTPGRDIAPPVFELVVERIEPE